MKRGDPITPETKVGDLLDAYPELEARLVELSPRFEKLKNPLLRRTVARAANLVQAASIGGVPIATLVGALRSAAGQSVAPGPENGDPTQPAASFGGGDPAEGPPPDWVATGIVKEVVDADAMLASGSHPLGLVRQKAMELEDGELLRLEAGFRPAPLIELLAEAGHRLWEREAAGRFQLFIGSVR